MTEEINSREEFDKLLTEAKHSGVPKSKVRSFFIAVYKFMDNNAGFFKTYDAVIQRELVMALKANAAKMGATKEQLALYDAVIKTQDDLLAAYTKDEGEHVES